MSALLPEGETAATERLGSDHNGRFIFPCYGPSLPGGPGYGLFLLKSHGDFPPSRRRGGESVVYLGEKGSESSDYPKQQVLTRCRGEEAADRPQGVGGGREGGGGKGVTY